MGLFRTMLWELCFEDRRARDYLWAMNFMDFEKRPRGPPMHLHQVVGGTSEPSDLAHRLSRLQRWQRTAQPGDVDSKSPICKLCVPEQSDIKIIISELYEKTKSYMCNIHICTGSNSTEMSTEM